MKKSFAEYLVIFLYIFFLIFALISVLFSVNFRQSLSQHLIYLVSFFIFITAQAVFHDYKLQKKLSFTLIIVTLLLSFVSLYETVIKNYVNKEGEGVSFMWVYSGHNHLSALLIFALPLSVYFLKIYWSKTILRIIFLTISLVLILSLSFTFARASIIALFLASILSFLVFSVSSKKKIIAAIIAIVLSVFVLNNFGWANKIGIDKDNLAIETRFIYWQAAWSNFLKKPLTGSGLDTFSHVKPTNPKYKSTGTYYAHNFFLQILSDAGIFSFLTGFGLISMVLWLGFKRVKKEILTERKLLLWALWVGIFASTLNSLVDFDWQLPTVFYFFWLLAGSIV